VTAVRTEQKRQEKLRKKHQADKDIEENAQARA
jgi:hypothetical protein